MEELGLMERFADPVLFDSLTTGEKAAASLVTTLMGMGTTFIILILLWGIIAFISGIIRRAEQKAAAHALAKSVGLDVKSAGAVAIGVIPAAQTAAPQQEAVSVSMEAGQELIAVLMAAIAASSGEGEISKFKVRKIERISGFRTPWNTASTADCIESRKF